jgi:ABC-type Zn uptake system ZnuABC Zn-binding protein ZnuA
MSSGITRSRITRRVLRALSLAGALAIVFTLVGCASNSGPASTNPTDVQLTPVASLRPVQLDSARRLRVIATTSIAGDVVGQVGGQAIDLQTLMPLGVDPHTYEPTPRDIQAVAQADIVFVNGLGLEETLLPRLVNAGGHAALVSLSEGITPRVFRADSTSASSMELEQGGVDPHVWQDPRNVIQWTENAAEALSRLDPAGEVGYRQRAQAYRAQLEQLDAEIQAMVGTVPPDQRKLVTDHDDLGYFADRYGFTIVGAVIPAYSTSAEPSARDISQLEDAVKKLGVKAVFVGVEANQALSARVAQDTGVRLVPIYAASLSPADGPAPSYVKLMLYNVSAIVEALK